jgi:hypothetical protein
MRPLLGLCAFLLAPAAWAGDDFHPANLGWNGGAKLFTIGQQAGLRPEARSALDLSALDLRTGVLFLGPARPLPEALHDFIRAGGRVAVADDFGASEEFLAPYGLRRIAEPRATVVYGGLSYLPLAFPLRRHILLWGIDSLVTNHPSALRRTGRGPLLAFDGDAGLLHVVRDGDGELVALSDPSIFLNQMLGFGDNEHFARSLLRYLTRGTHRRRLWILSGHFEVQGALRPDLRPRGGAGLANDLRSLAEEGAYGANAVGWELRDQRPVSGVLMALAVFSGGAALLFLAALWGGSGSVSAMRSPSPPREAPLPLERAGRQERMRLAAALRREVEERLGEAEPAPKDEVARLRRALETLPAGVADAGAHRISARHLRHVLALAERVLGPLAPAGGV